MTSVESCSATDIARSGSTSRTACSLAATTSAPLVEADVLRLPMRDGAADGVTCGFALRNVVDLAAFFAELGRVVRGSGRIALLDASEPGQSP